MVIQISSIFMLNFSCFPLYDYKLDFSTSRDTGRQIFFFAKSFLRRKNQIQFPPINFTTTFIIFTILISRVSHKHLTPRDQRTSLKMKPRRCLCSSIISGNDDARLRKLRACMSREFTQFRRNVIFVVKTLIRIYVRDATRCKRYAGECAIDRGTIDTETRYYRAI